MKKIMLAIGLCWLVGCSVTQQAPINSGSRNTLSIGAAVTADLNAKWAETRPNCPNNSETAPSFVCSGVVIRTTDYGDSYNVWDAKPGKAFVSFSFMRQDSRFPALFDHKTNGYIVTPVAELSPTQYKFSYLCFFPIDGATEWRLNEGCGEHKLQGCISRYCSSQNIDTADKFVAHYIGNSPVREQKQCSFDVRDNSPYNTAALFREALLAMSRIPKNGVYDENELVVRAWPPQNAIRMPIKAFFYTAGSVQGLTDARKNQSSYYLKSGGKVVPIVMLTIYQPHWDVLFTYSDTDQVYL